MHMELVGPIPEGEEQCFEKYFRRNSDYLSHGIYMASSTGSSHKVGRAFCPRGHGIMDVYISKTTKNPRRPFYKCSN
ncbi:uncharacterized protein LOC143864114 isoform X7 [Tasmannia lanceolata]|uniref:uncharacterized protein LOC143864114 isoform X7 n=1 Tax=Tasmannia lanceolata TaxID=3420 RepID=UPI0040637413